MLTLEYKLDGSNDQYRRIDDAIRTVQFVRNKCLRKWEDERGTSANDLQIYSSELAHTFPFTAKLNAQARQASADRAWFAIKRFYANCAAKKLGKKGYPRFQHNNRSVEYKVTGWKLGPDGRHITFTDGHGIGRLRLVGTRSIEAFPVEQIKRVRLIRRAVGYFIQFCVHAERHLAHQPTGKVLGIDVGLYAYYTDSDGAVVPNPRYLRKREKRLKHLHRRVSRKQKGSRNRTKARQRLAKAYLKVRWQREDFARKQANALVSSHDLIAYEDLHVRNMVRNHHLAQSISDAAWARFLWWVSYYGRLYGITVRAVPPQYTSQNCSGCGQRVRKSLSMRTHVCPSCGLVMDRDQNAARNILAEALSTAGQAGTGSA